LAQAGRYGRVVGLDMTGYNSRAVKENGGLPPFETLICGRCATVCDVDDNFCRRCGMALQDSQLPSVRNGRALPVAWRPRVPAVVMKGAAFIAAGTLAELVIRRAVRRAFGQAGRLPASKARGELAGRDGGLPEETQLLSEMFLLRRVRIRR